MLSRRVVSAARLSCRAAARNPLPRTPLSQMRFASQSSQASGEVLDPTDPSDPNMNGGYINPPAQKRQFRDPYGDWWDKQDRRNFGEPVHEDNDILTTFTTESYTHFTPGKGLVLMGCAISFLFALSGTVYLFYPDKPSAPRTFPDGLEKELGGPNALIARKPHEDKW